MTLTHQIETPFGEPGYSVLAGSRLYGIDTVESDYDYVAALIEPRDYRVGIVNYHPTGKQPQHGFEQHEFSGDNFEGSAYSLWKLASMFAEGNPTVLCLLFAEPIQDLYGINTDEFREIVVSARSGHRFMKYMQAQRKSMIGQRAQHVKRLELIDAYGYDTKFAGHLIRLGYQGCEFLDTGSITLPMPESERQAVLGIRTGQWRMDDVIALSENLEAEMEKSLGRTPLPAEADFDALNKWLVERYMDAYTPKKRRWFQKNA